MMIYRYLYISLCLVGIAIATTSCGDGNRQTDTRFQLLEANQTGIDFQNNVPYSDSFNCYVYRNFYNGGGVAIGDLNNDLLPDIFFCGNVNSNKLYLNKGDFKFEDITEKSGTSSKGVWSAGVAMADINGDGWLDIYVTKSGPPGGEKRYNELYINAGADASGAWSGRFLEASKEWGLDFKGLSTHAVFFDYDRDGDLDCYLLNNSIRSVGGYDLRPGQRNTPDPNGGNRFLRNALISKDGNSKPIFEDITTQAGIYSSAIGFGLGVTIGDYDQDGWQDMFVSNDFFERDYLYHNRGDGTFEEVLESAMSEISKGSMGADMADLNNDGYPEIFVTEMTPPDEPRYKTKASFDNWNTYKLTQNAGYHRQFGRNVLQLNNGNGTFSEIGRQAGTAATDWSWGALAADFDNDGRRDIFVANGIGKDLLDQDYLNFYSDPAAVREILKQNPGKGIKALIDKMPAQPLSNYLFQQQSTDQIQFNNVAQTWGLDQPSFSNGSAYGDLDNDGDLDLVVNNVDMPCFTYRNETIRKGDKPNQNSANWLKTRLKGSQKNTFALGAKVILKSGNQTWYQELAPMRGFESCVDYALHFGLGTLDNIDDLWVVFPSGKIIHQKSVKVNQYIELAESDARPSTATAKSILSPESQPIPIFKNANAPVFKHEELDYSDFDQEPLLFRMYSAEGSCIAVADVNGDQREDFYIGGGAGQAGILYLQTAIGSFSASLQPDFETDKAGEDVTAQFFDADNDQDLDLYVGSGSNEFQVGNPALQDRLYLNNGQGKFTRKIDALPTGKPFSTACVRAADIDGDQDMDLFVGMRMIPGHYGQLPTSFWMVNNGHAQFSPMPITQLLDQELELGMVTDAIWSDIDHDNDPDLIVVGEWQPLRILVNHQGRFKSLVYKNGDLSGWWNCIQKADLDEDGDEDFVLGNWGQNTRFKASKTQPLSLFTSDFEQNGRDESILCQYYGETSYPLVLRSDLLKQLPILKKKYLKYEDYKSQKITDIFSKEQIAAAQKNEVNYLETSVLWNQGNGNFKIAALPYQAQLSPVYAALADDFNQDGKMEILLAGNHERCKPETGIYLASKGCLLGYEGGQKFKAISNLSSGLTIDGSVRALATIRVKGKKKILVGRNNNTLQMIEI